MVLLGVCLGVFAGLVHSSELAFLILNPPALSAGRLPADWQVKVNRGTPDIAVERQQDGASIHLRSRKSSFALERGLDVDPSQFPYLCWRWKVSELPQGGDFRRARTDDQAAQVLVAFQDRRVLTYIWDSTAPKGTVESASSIPLVHIFAFVCESGAQELNRWVSEARNVAADYEKAYGRRAVRVKGIRLQINSQHTGTSAESYFGEVAFRVTPQ